MVAPAITIQDPTGEIAQLALDVNDYSAQDVLNHLFQEGMLMRTSPDGHALIYKLAYGGTTLASDGSLGSQGVKPGSVLELMRVNEKG